MNIHILHINKDSAGKMAESRACVIMNSESEFNTVISQHVKDLMYTCCLKILHRFALQGDSRRSWFVFYILVIIDSCMFSKTTFTPSAEAAAEGVKETSSILRFFA